MLTDEREALVELLERVPGAKTGAYSTAPRRLVVLSCRQGPGLAAHAFQGRSVDTVIGPMEVNHPVNKREAAQPWPWPCRTLRRR